MSIPSSTHKRKRDDQSCTEMEKRPCSPREKLLGELESFSKSKNVSQVIHELLFSESNKKYFFRRLDHQYFTKSPNINKDYQKAKESYQKKIRKLEEIFKKEVHQTIQKIKALAGIPIDSSAKVKDLQKWLAFDKIAYVLNVPRISNQGKTLFEEFFPDRSLRASGGRLLFSPRIPSSSFPSLQSLKEEIQQLPITDQEKKRVIKSISDILLGKSDMLDLSNCNIGCLPEGLKHLTQVKKLNLSNTQLRTIPKWIGRLSNLEELDLSGNDFVSCPEELFQLSNIRKLYLSRTKLSKIPDSIEKLTHLEELDISGNDFRSCPDGLFKLTNLKILTIDEKHLDFLNSHLSSFKQLQNLVLNDSSFLEAFRRIGVQEDEMFELYEQYIDVLMGKRNSLELNKYKLHVLPKGLKYLVHLKELSLFDCRLDELPDWIGDLTNLEALDISENGIVDLPESFRNLSKLQSLECDECQFEFLPEVLEDLINLEKLSLVGCALIELPSFLIHFSKLQKLDISQNSITSMPRGFSTLSNLRFLIMNGNAFEEFPEEVCSLTKLEELDIENCGFESLPETIGDLLELKELILNGNDITILPASFEKLTKLEILEYANNRLEKIPPPLKKLTNLKELNVENNLLGQNNNSPLDLAPFQKLRKLDISGNELQTFPIGIDRSPLLEELSCNSNFIESIPLLDLPKLKKLTLQANLLQELPNLEKLAQLEKLDCSINPALTHLPNSLCKLKTLKKLDCSDCKIKELPDEIGELENLRILIANLNRLTLLPSSFSALSNLQVLDVRDNQLTEWTDELCQLRSLKKLLLSENSITHISNKIAQLLRLEELTIDQNKLASVPDSIFILTPFMRFVFDSQENDDFTIEVEQNIVRRIHQARREKEVAEQRGEFYTRPRPTLDIIYLFANKKKRDLALDPLPDPSENASAKEREKISEENATRARKKRVLESFISRISESNFFFHNPEECSKAFLTFLHYSLENERFSQRFYGYLEQAGATCGDRIAYYLNKINAFYYLESKQLPKGMTYDMVIVGDRRLTLLDQEAEKFCSENADKVKDQIEVYLYLQQQLCEKLGLPIFQGKMRYAAFAPTEKLEKEIASIEKRILEQTADPKKILLQSKIWREFIISRHKREYTIEISNNEAFYLPTPDEVTNVPYGEKIKEITEKREKAIEKFIEEKTSIYLSEEPRYLEEMEEKQLIRERAGLID